MDDHKTEVSSDETGLAHGPEEATAGMATSAPEPSRTLTLEPFLLLTRELSALLAPVRPRPEFHTELYRSLMTAAEQQEARRLLAIHIPLPESSDVSPGWSDRMLRRLHLQPGQRGRRWVIGAAAVGSAVSVAGVLAYRLRNRQHSVA